MKKFTFLLVFMMSVLTLAVGCSEREGAVGGGDGIEREEAFGEEEGAFGNEGVIEEGGEAIDEAGDDVQETL